MVRISDGAGPGAFDEGQARAYAAASEIDTIFPHDRVFLDFLRRHARGAALDLGGGNGRYAAWLLHTGLATSVHVIDQSPAMIQACSTREVPGLSAQLGDIEQTDLGRTQYDIVLARFVLMHIRDLDSALSRMARSLTPQGRLVAVTNVIRGTMPAVTAFLEATSQVMSLVVQVKGQPIPVSNYARTPEEYASVVRQAGLTMEWFETYEPKIVHFANEHPGVTLAHLVLVGKKSDL